MTPKQSTSYERAFIIRCAPSYNSQLDQVREGEIMIGWSKTTDELLEPSLTRNEFKPILIKHYNGYAENGRSLGQATGYLWRFIREMQIGDLALIPTRGAFYLAEITSDAYSDEHYMDTDSVIRRKVKLLSEDPISRSVCPNGLVSRLKYQGTCVSASDLIDQVLIGYQRHLNDSKPSYQDELRDELKIQVSNFLKSDSNLLNSDSMEYLVRDLMGALGADEKIIVPKSKYPKGTDVDVIALFHKLQTAICIQVKKHDHSTGTHSIDQILKGLPLVEEEFNYGTQGWVINTGNFDESADALAKAEKIRLINGDELAEMILDAGLERIFMNSND